LSTLKKAKKWPKHFISSKQFKKGQIATLNRLSFFALLESFFVKASRKILLKCKALQNWKISIKALSK
jgi:hypothetical protein